MKQVRQQQGFTLIEIIVVVSIVALLAAVVTVSIGSNTDRHARLQAQRFMAVVNNVQDKAILTGGYFALQINEDAGSYEFSVLHQADLSVPDSDITRPRIVTEGVKLNWEVLEDLPNDDSDPQVLISGLGEISLFEARFGGDDTDFVVFVTEDGVIDVREENARIYN